MRLSPSAPDRAARLGALIAKPFAHRGLHGGGRVENSRAAFAAAIAAGHGIELDVQASANGEAIVFHDYQLERLTEGAGALSALSAAALCAIPLKGTHETIPTLKEILALIAGRAPLLIEVKSPGRSVGLLCRAVQDALADYAGPVAVMSFNPAIGVWFAGAAPEILRGLVVTEQGKGWRGAIERRVALWWARPDFLAYDLRDLPSRFAAKSHLPVLTWTVRSQDDRVRAQQADQIIFERFPL